MKRPKQRKLKLAQSARMLCSLLDVPDAPHYDISTFSNQEKTGLLLTSSAHMITAMLCMITKFNAVEAHEGLFKLMTDMKAQINEMCANRDVEAIEQPSPRKRTPTHQ